MIKFKKTNRTLIEVGFMLRKGLRQELIDQKHNATGKLSRGLRYHIKGNVLSIHSSVSYWKAVNNPFFAKIPNLNAIKKILNSCKERNAKSKSISKNHILYQFQLTPPKKADVEVFMVLCMYLCTHGMYVHT